MIYLHVPIKSPGTGPTASSQAQRVFRPGRLFSHLMADTEEELRAYAASVGLPIAWIQKSGTGLVHFDITGDWLVRLQQDPRVNYCTLVEWLKWRLSKQSNKPLDNTP